jgi:NAD(P)-dependent dehydrogenase (short-subunit alcohol dehydrogenase family)
VALLVDRVAVITGASKGIGRVMSVAFAREGAKVVCAARSDGLVRETVAAVQAAGGEAVPVVADVSTESGAKAAVDAGITDFSEYAAVPGTPDSELFPDIFLN